MLKGFPISASRIQSHLRLTHIIWRNFSQSSAQAANTKTASWIGRGTVRAKKDSGKFVPPKVTSTLRPERLQPSDYVNLSYKRSHFLSYKGQRPPSEVLYFKTNAQKHPFPKDTHGFFYHRPFPRDEQPLFAGGIRFRICPSDDPSTFKDGFDLLSEEGLPWQISHFELTLSNLWNPLKQSLTRYNAFTFPEIFDATKKVAETIRMTNSPTHDVVWAFGQPFAMMLGQETTNLYIVGFGGMMYRVTLFNNILETLPTRGWGNPGIQIMRREYAHVCFDKEGDDVLIRLLSVPPNHAKGRFVHNVGDSLPMKYKAKSRRWMGDIAKTMIKGFNYSVHSVPGNSIVGLL
ncbi:hypothetical protein D9758_007990 [Tetrapyrgos nigripes]|uniref:Uncharacterized protein n=1 Tax=Tetrapyrgos nigripes TaxID=182062 RepID=A0A8H5D350_9AGAR|nr:hypothetical protein D9758_007990 [Tetrapyrgos nigripes]